MTQATPETTPPTTQQPSSTTPQEKSGYASELLAYTVVDHLGDVIANQVSHKLRSDKNRARLLLVGSLEQVLGGVPMAEIEGQLSLLEGAFQERERDNERILNAPVDEPAAEIAVAGVASLISAIGGITGTVSDVVALFRSDFKFSERDFDVKDPALLSSVAGNLARQGFTVFVPGFYPSDNSVILAKLADLSHQAARLKTQRDALASLLPKPDGKDEPGSQEVPRPRLSAGRLAEIAAAVQKTAATLLTFEGFRSSWTTPPQSQTQTKLERALIQEQIDKLEITHFLWLGTLSSGGEEAVRTSLVKGERIGFMGGAAVNFVLVHKGGESSDRAGQVLEANTYAQYGTMGGDLRDYMARSTDVRYIPAEFPRGGSGGS
jgi:hypothetical protein